MSKRFNLWEKLIVENEDIDLPEAELADEELEDEIEDSLYDLMVNFILNIPEDAVPEDMLSNYNTLIAEIGDNYLGGDEEEVEYDEDGEELPDDRDEPILSDENLKEEQIQFTIELPSGTRIALANDAERKRATSAVKYFAKQKSDPKDKELMRFVALAIKQKGVNIREVYKNFLAATSDVYKDVFSKAGKAKK